MSDVALAELVDWVSSFDLFVLFPFLRDEGHQDVFFENRLVEEAVARLLEGNLDYFDDLVVQDVVHVILFDQVEQNGEKVLLFGN